MKPETLLDIEQRGHSKRLKYFDALHESGGAKCYTHKTIEWSYPTSSNAERLGFKDTGCWSVERTGLAAATPVAVRGFQERADALVFAKTMPEPFSPLFLHFHPEDGR